MNTLLICLGKTLSFAITTLNLGGGSTWPGHIALKINPNFPKDSLKNSKAKKIVIAGTNGKTTTGKLLTTVLKESNLTIAHNAEGANLINGLASTLILNSDITGRFNKNILIFESDENAFTKVLEMIKPDYVILLNLFRDQMDRYGEIDSTAKKWKEALLKSKTAKFLLNADDPAVSYLGKDLKNQIIYFGLPSGNQKKLKHGADSIYCPKCYGPLSYKFITFSHLGDWHCEKCGLKRPSPVKSTEYPSNLQGEYNKYNISAAATLAHELRIPNKNIKKALSKFKPAFGRQETVSYKNRKIKLFLSKNPTSFNESLSTIESARAKNVLLVLNDRIPDGQDVSWIWDIDTTPLFKMGHIMVTGDRVFDMALRLRYADLSFNYERNLNTALLKAIEKTAESETLYILPTYSAMLDLRKIIKGRKLL